VARGSKRLAELDDYGDADLTLEYVAPGINRPIEGDRRGGLVTFGK